MHGVYEILFIKSLLFTILIELIVCLIFIRFIYKIDCKKITNTKFLLSGLASMSTLPYIWFVFPIIISNHQIFIIISELFAFILEAIFYKFYFPLQWKKAFLLSFFANLISFTLGLFIF